MDLRSRLLYSQNWNIGFCNQTPEELVNSKSLNKIQWMKHPYRDRWFADPFIYKVTADDIVVFVEECPIENSKGILCELVLDKRTKRLKQRHVLLELGTHLSYPAIIRENGKVYVYPENGASGKLNIYEYDETNHRLVNPICILDEAVADSTIMKDGERYVLIATHYPDTQEKVYLYESNSLFGPFKELSDKPFQLSKSCSRPGGNWIRLGDCIYRPAQNCMKRYGAALSIMGCNMAKGVIMENILFSLTPMKWNYSLGIHTINFHERLCVVDGRGYLYPIAARALYLLSSIKRRLL